MIFKKFLRKTLLSRRQLNFLLHGHSGELFGSVGCQNNYDRYIKKIKKISIITVTYESGRMSLLRDLTISSAQKFVFYLFHCNLKEKDHIRRKINSEKNM